MAADIIHVEEYFRVAPYLYDQNKEQEYPEKAKSFPWILGQLRAGKSRIYAPDSFGEFPFDRNKHLQKCKDMVSDDRFLCGFFKNPQPNCDLVYFRPLKDAQTLGTHTFVLSPYESARFLLFIMKSFGSEKLCEITDNAEAFSGMHQ